MTDRADTHPTLAARLRAGEFITAPGVYDMISARIADTMGFPAIYMTGSGTVASHLGLPDAGIATYTDMVSRAAQIVRGTTTPLIADRLIPAIERSTSSNNASTLVAGLIELVILPGLAPRPVRSRSS